MWKWKLQIFVPLLFFLIQNSYGLSRIDPLVDSPVGLIRGLRATDGDYSMFLGIPYATVNKSNPFGPSTPQPRFDEPFEAYDDSAICPQVNELTNAPDGTLDCLNLNIYVPNSANYANRLPIMVWIHGGALMTGFSGRQFYGPQYLVKKDVILVTLNYRLGPYGFMCLNTPDVPGNQGLKDQQLALKWIKNNIESFGGDSDKITIFGESAGAVSVDAHLIYSKVKLFNKVIMQSGAALCPLSVLEPDASAPLKMSGRLGFATMDIEEALSFLSAVDTNLVIASSAELGLIFTLCVEKKYDSIERFIHDYPVNIEPDLENIPILSGYNSEEALAMYELLTPDDFTTLNLFFDNLETYFNFDYGTLTEMEAFVRHFYIGDATISEKVKEELIRFHSDFMFYYPAMRTVQKYLKIGAGNMYYYLFDYDGDRNVVKNRLNITTGGAAHADELGYLFGIPMLSDPTPEDQLIIDRITMLWTNFAKYGNPTPETNELLPVQWPAATLDLLYYLSISSELKIGRRNFYSRMAFWELFYKLNEKYQLGYE